jgi:Mg-chelatase subunit ChlD
VPGEGYIASNPTEELLRWRLILGIAAADAFERIQLSADEQAQDAALDWLYERDGSLDERDIRRGSLGPSVLTVPDWISEVHRLFPKETIERLERDAVEQYGLHEVVTNPEVLARIEPSPTLLRAVLLTKHLMNQEVLTLAKNLVRKVVQALLEKLAKVVRSSFSGMRLRRRSRMRLAANFDARGTIKKNLKHFDAARAQLVIQEPLFWSRSTRQNEKWQIIMLVDESGSMMSSVIHAAVTAACLWGLPSVKTHLVIFDTEVVDLTGQISDPVETLMKVQLGGGTDIARAVAYGESLVENPRRTMVVLITDLYEGGDARALVRSVKRLHAAGVKVLVLAALDDQANPNYDRALGRELTQHGAHVGAMTPMHLVEYLKGIIG